MTTLAKPAAPLMRIEEARALLAQCVRVDEVKKIRDQASAIQAYMRQEKASRAAANDAGEIKLRAERRLGELLALQKAEGKRAAPAANLKRGPKAQRAPSEKSPSPTLKDLGIPKDSSTRWQKAASVPEPVFEQHLAEQRAKPDGEITSAGLRKLAARPVRREHDWYPTPLSALAPILGALNLPAGRWLEPAAGDGSIVRAVARADVEWVLVELREDALPLLSPLGAADCPTDYLERPAPFHRYDVGIANPPFVHAEAFVRKMLAECEIVVALLPLAFAASKGRLAFHRQHPSDLYVLADRPSFTGDGKTDSNDCAWFVFGLTPGGSWRVLGSAPSEEA